MTLLQTLPNPATQAASHSPEALIAATHYRGKRGERSRRICLDFQLPGVVAAGQMRFAEA
jgi:hypothetical protein